MDMSASETHSPIEQLLEERARFEQWLVKLDEAGNTAPEPVRQRVRADYRQRLEGVLDQLRSHSSTITADLERHRDEQRVLEESRAATQEQLSEAEVRHMVGEYPDDEWERISREHQGRLGELDGSLERVHGEINRLEEVQRLIEQPPPAAAAPADMSPPEEPVQPAPPQQPAAGAAAASRPSGPTPRPSGPNAAPADELAFLQSVTAGAPRRPAEGARTASAAAASDAAGHNRAGSTTAAKTLKCGECGTLNRPTEWYCERCGAELAAL